MKETPATLGGGILPYFLSLEWDAQWTKCIPTPQENQTQDNNSKIKQRKWS